MIEINHISYGYESEKVLHNFTLQIKDGEFLAILGKNGSGKSTLAKLLTGIYIPDEGNILINGFNTKNDEIWEIRKKLGVVFQNPEDQFVGNTPHEDMSFILENYNIKNTHHKYDKIIDMCLKKVSLEHKKFSNTNSFSGGEKQKLALATALLLSPNLIILDEASSMLDPYSRKELLELIKELNDAGTTVIYITHMLEEVTYAKRCILLNSGNIVLDKRVEELFKDDCLSEKVLEDNNLVLPYYLSLILKLNKNKNKNFKLENSKNIVDAICQYL